MKFLQSSHWLHQPVFSILLFLTILLISNRFYCYGFHCLGNIDYRMINSINHIKKFTLPLYNNKNDKTQSSLPSSSSDPEKPSDIEDTRFSRTIDDFIGKRFGAGEAFYGKRTTRMSETEYQSSRGIASAKLREMESKPFRDNAILLVGDVHQGVAEWISFDLYEKGFNIRLACTDKKKSIFVYGLPSNNVDMIELSPSSSEELYAKAIEGVQGIIFCGNFEPTLSFFKKESQLVFDVSRKILNIAIKAQQASVSKIKKIVLVSRFTNYPESQKSFFSIDYPQSKLYDDFEKIHLSIESMIYNQNYFDFVIVRAPPIVSLSRMGSIYDLELKNINIGSDNSSPFVTINTDEKKKSFILPQIGVLDLAETIVYSLILDNPSKSFTVYEDLRYLLEKDNNRGDGDGDDDQALLPTDLKSNTLAGSIAISSSRPYRKSYYSILNMNEKEIMNTYMMKSVEAYNAQLSEDEIVEQYWEKKFSQLKRK